ncbi:hypothetical protein N8500_04580 [Candidatus Puniceispirillum sp.]|nr:hypothetical protein [Candidatus Puniceispirillum sp.]
MSEFCGPFAVVCHDSGAANLLIAYLDDCLTCDIKVCMLGPAFDLWSRRYGKKNLVGSISEAIDGCKTLVSGTGWASSVEHDARWLAKRNGMRSIAALDHWVNYPERFIRDNITVLPDEFWVFDEFALAEAKLFFPERSIKLKKNKYLERSINLIKVTESAIPKKFLYLLEPIRNDWGFVRAGEFQALDYFINRLSEIKLPNDFHLVLRPHPSDAPGKYDDWIKIQKNIFVTIDDKFDLFESIGEASWVGGCETYALVVALEAGYPVLCTLPPWAIKSRLPMSNLINLSKVANNELLHLLFAT